MLFWWFCTISVFFSEKLFCANCSKWLNSITTLSEVNALVLQEDKQVMWGVNMCLWFLQIKPCMFKRKLVHTQKQRYRKVHFFADVPCQRLAASSYIYTQLNVYIHVYIHVSAFSFFRPRVGVSTSSSRRFQIARCKEKRVVYSVFSVLPKDYMHLLYLILQMIRVQKLTGTKGYHDVLVYGYCPCGRANLK